MTAGLSPGGRPIDESPLSTSKTDNWVARTGGLPPYVRGIARGIAKKHGGKVTSSDIQMAWSAVEKLAATSKHPAVKAAAAKAVAQEKALQAKAHAKDLARNGRGDISLNWAAFDQARGSTPRQPAQQQPQQGQIAGYNGPAMSAATIAKIKAFQKANGLPVTGALDAGTVNEATKYPAKVKAAAAAKAAGKKSAAAQKKAAAQAASAQKKQATATAKTAKAAISAATKQQKAQLSAQKAQTAAQTKSAKAQVTQQKAAIKAAATQAKQHTAVLQTAANAQVQEARKTAQGNVNDLRVQITEAQQATTPDKNAISALKVALAKASAAYSAMPTKAPPVHP